MPTLTPAIHSQSVPGATAPLSAMGLSQVATSSELKLTKAYHPSLFLEAASHQIDSKIPRQLPDTFCHYNCLGEEMDSWGFLLCRLPWCHLIASYNAYKFFILIKSNFSIFSFVVYAFDVIFKETIAKSKVRLER